MRSVHVTTVNFTLYFVAFNEIEIQSLAYLIVIRYSSINDTLLQIIKKTNYLYGKFYGMKSFNTGINIS